MGTHDLLKDWSRQGPPVTLELFTTTHPGVEPQVEMPPRVIAPGLKLLVSGDEHDYDHVDLLEQIPLNVTPVLVGANKLTHGCYETPCVVCDDGNAKYSYWV